MLKVWMSHGDKVLEMPPGFALMASTPNRARSPQWPTRRAVSTACNGTRKSRTPCRAARCSNASCCRLCGARADWEMGHYIDEAVAKIREQVGSEQVILGLSGGVDSSVAAALLHRAIGDQLTCVFVDHGLLRLNEAEQVMAHVRRPPRREGDSRRRERGIPEQARRRDRSGSEAQDHRRGVRRSVPGGSRQADGREVARAGHDLSGRDRIGGARARRPRRPSRAITTWAACPRR